MAVIDLSGVRFGFLVAVQRDGSMGRRAAWRCKCDCGEVIRARSDRLVGGRKKSCGVNGHRSIGVGFHDYRLADLDEYKVWSRMKDRCGNPKNHKWADYGGRGIRVCPRWEISFEAFLSDIGPRPSSKHSIDRFPDPNGGYEPGNCRWATAGQQARNKRNSIYLEHNGRRVMLVDLAAEFGLGYDLLAGRLRMGWPLDRALSAPVRPKRANSRPA